MHCCAPVGPHPTQVRGIRQFGAKRYNMLQCMSIQYSDSNGAQQGANVLTHAAPDF
jgi:hypothetical protein